jgi:acetylcholinesterase
MMRSLINLVVCLSTTAATAPSREKRAGPVVTLDTATIVGSSLLGIDSFKGIPYARPLIGKLRLKPPQPITSSPRTVVATGIPKSCPQFFTQANTISLPGNVLSELINTPIFQTVTDAGEDGLTVNVQ